MTWKTPLNSALGAYNSKTARWNLFILSIFDKYDKTQILQSFKKILQVGFRATLNFWNFWKFKVPLNPTYGGYAPSSSGSQNWAVVQKQHDNSPFLSQLAMQSYFVFS